jgi:hypothetical protein
MTTWRDWFNRGTLKAFPHVQRRLELANAYQAAFQSGDGRIVLRDLLQQGGLLSVSHVEGDSHATAFNDGKRAMALHIVERLRWSEGEMLRLGEEVTLDQVMAHEAQREAQSFIGQT